MKLYRLKINDEFSYYGVKHSVYAIKPPNISIQRIEGDNLIYDVDYFSLISDASFIPNEQLSDTLKGKVEKKSKKKFQSSIDNLSDEKRGNLSKKYELIKPILMLEEIKEGIPLMTAVFTDIHNELMEKDESILDLNKEKLYQRISKKKNDISVRQLKRYVSNYKKVLHVSPKNGLNGLISKRDLNNKVRPDEKAIELCHPKKADLVLAVIYTRLDKAYVPIIKEAIEKHYLNKRKITVLFIAK